MPHLFWVLRHCFIVSAYDYKYTSPSATIPPATHCSHRKHSGYHFRSPSRSEDRSECPAGEDGSERSSSYPIPSSTSGWRRHQWSAIGCQVTLPLSYFETLGTMFDLSVGGDSIVFSLLFFSFFPLSLFLCCF